MGTPAGTARSRLHYALQQLRSALEADARPDNNARHGMTRDDDFIGQLEGYLDEYEGSTPLPDEVRDAIRAQLPSINSARPGGPRGGCPSMNNRLRLGVAAVAVVAAALGYGLMQARRHRTSAQARRSSPICGSDGCTPIPQLCLGPSRRVDAGIDGLGRLPRSRRPGLDQVHRPCRVAVVRQRCGSSSRGWCGRSRHLQRRPTSSPIRATTTTSATVRRADSRRSRGRDSQPTRPPSHPDRRDRRWLLRHGVRSQRSDEVIVRRHGRLRSVGDDHRRDRQWLSGERSATHPRRRRPRVVIVGSYLPGHRRRPRRDQRDRRFGPYRATGRLISAATES